MAVWWQQGFVETASHFVETLLGVGPHLDSLRKRRQWKRWWMKTWTMKHLECGSRRNRDRRPKYLFAHADLHNGIADECFMQIFVFLLLEALDVLPGCLNKLSVDTPQKGGAGTEEVVRISASAATAAHAPASKCTWYPGTLSEWRPVPKVLKVWFLRSSCRERSWKLLTSCWSYRHSAFFCFSAASPSWMFCSKAVSLLSLCSWLSWPNSLLVIPFREKTRTVCVPTQIQQLTRGFMAQNHPRWTPDYYWLCDVSLMGALPQWPALLSAAFYRPGPAPPTPTHTGSAHASYTLPWWYTQTSPPWCSWCWTSFWPWFEHTRLLTSRRRCRTDILSAGLRSAPLPPKCHLLMRHICKLHPGREKVWDYWDCCPIPAGADDTHVSMWCPALCSPSPISFSIALHSLVTEEIKEELHKLVE